jgi:lipopolysaccharide/colanic/teichoic acid biosynthesis glycosyltransferase/glycosyltransferase involved in cell wall biosynthesis
MNRSVSPTHLPPPHWARDIARRHVALATCIGGSVVERLALALEEHGIPARTVAEISPDDWRRAMSRSRLTRVAARARSYVVFPARAILDTVRSVPELVVTTTNPFVLPIALVATRPLHDRPVVVLAYDLYPDAIEAAGLIAKNGVVSRALAATTRYWMSRADAVVFIGDTMRQHARTRYGAPRRDDVIETGADAREFRHDDVTPASELEDFARARPCFSYVGNMGAMHDWQTLSQAGLAIAGRAPGDAKRRPRFVVAASGIGAQRLRENWSVVSDNDARFSAPLDDAAWARLLSISEVAIVTLREEAAETSVPSKTFSAMAAGNAILAIAPARSDLAKLVRETRCGLVVEPGDVAGLIAAIDTLSDESVRGAMQVAALGAIRDRYGLDVIAGRWAKLLDDTLADRARQRTRSRPAQRVLDVAGSALALAATSPALVGAAAAVKATMKGPVFFRQQRAGRDGSPFLIRKIRSMRPPRADEGELTSDADRLTPVGRFVRATSLDELPTLLSVLMGDMHLVGPRPLLLRYNERYSAAQRARLRVKPGITGWAQVHGRNAISWRAKFALDAWYVENESLLLDVRILLATVAQVLFRRGISADGHATMPEFMGDSVEPMHENKASPSASRERS